MAETLYGFEENEVSSGAAGGTEIAKRMLGKILDPELLSNFQIVCSRVRELRDDKIRVFWANDLPGDPESAWVADERERSRFHHFVFISAWQYEQYRIFRGLPYSVDSSIIGTGIQPAVDEIASKPRDSVSLYYASTPNRGLNILIPAFEHLHEKNPDVRLTVYSSFKLYGWSKADAQYEELFERCRSHPAIDYKGCVPHEQLLSEIQSHHILAYPCTWPETSCRVMIEAMSAGCLPVHPALGALPETSSGLSYMYDADASQNTHAGVFLGVLSSAVDLVKRGGPLLENRLRINKAVTDLRFNVGDVARKWDLVLRELLRRYPTPESRKRVEVFSFDSDE